MDFNSEQLKELEIIIKKYNCNENYRELIQDNYDNNPGILSILEIYALEEIIRYGNNGIFQSILEMKENMDSNSLIEQISEFLRLYRDDEIFREYKCEQLKSAPETLSELEKWCLVLISSAKINPVKTHEKLTDLLEYDDFNEIKYSTDKEIRNTLTNLLFGEFIHKIIELPEFAPIKVRQKKSGLIANVDKATVIDAVQKAIPGTLDKVGAIIDQRFISVKFNVLLGKGKDSFGEDLKYNTNISMGEIFQYNDKNKKK